MRNPFILPMWLMLAVGMIISWLIDVPEKTLIGLFAYVPWLVTLAALFLWEKRHPV